MKNLPPIYFFLLLLSAIGARLVLPLKQIIIAPYTYLGIIFIIFGSVIDFLSFILFKKNKTAVKPDGAPTFLLTTGPFRLSRNPLYLGMLSVLIGAAIFLGSLVAFIFPLTFFIIIEKIFIPLEEKKLEKTFGKNFLEYKKTARRWI